MQRKKAVVAGRKYAYNGVRLVLVREHSADRSVWVAKEERRPRVKHLISLEWLTENRPLRR